MKYKELALKLLKALGGDVEYYVDPDGTAIITKVVDKKFNQSTQKQAWAATVEEAELCLD